MKKKLYRNRENAMIGGVLAGISEYFDIDVTLTRVIYCVLTFFSTVFPGLLLYIILYFVMPDKSEIGFNDYDVK